MPFLVASLLLVSLPTLIVGSHSAFLPSFQEGEKARERAESNRRKEMMLKIEEEAKRNMPPTETEQLKRAKDGQTLSHAQARFSFWGDAAPPVALMGPSPSP